MSLNDPYGGDVSILITLIGCQPDHQDSNTVPTLPVVKKIKSFFQRIKLLLSVWRYLGLTYTTKSIDLPPLLATSQQKVLVFIRDKNVHNKPQANPCLGFENN